MFLQPELSHLTQPARSELLLNFFQNRSARLAICYRLHLQCKCREGCKIWPFGLQPPSASLVHLHHQSRHPSLSLLSLDVRQMSFERLGSRTIHRSFQPRFQRSLGLRCLKGSPVLMLLPGQRCLRGKECLTLRLLSRLRRLLR